MRVALSFLLSFCLLTFSVYKGIFVGYPLALVFCIFSYITWRKGFAPMDIIKMSCNGGKKAIVVLKIFVLIGAITGIWMASGTVPGIIYYGIKYMNPNFFIVYTFVISSIVAFLLGTSLGTVSTVGIALILMAKGGNVNVDITAGAIIAGAYFGDRCSPMSSSANLVSNLTDTNLYKNISRMVKTSIVPFILSIVLYFVFSLREPLNFMESKIDIEIIKVFKISWIVLLPAIIILILSILKVDVKISMIVSIIVASLIALIVQQYKIIEVLKYILIGFKLNKDSPLQSILKGGGIISMLKASLVVFISCSLAGIFEGTNMLQNIEGILIKAKTRYELFIYTTIVSILTAAFGCNQSISVVLTTQLMKKSYENKKVSKYELAIDLENTGIVLSALIPWNIAAFVPTTTMKVSSVAFIPYAFYLYLIPICNIIFLKFSKRDIK